MAVVASAVVEEARAAVEEARAVGTGAGAGAAAVVEQQLLPRRMRSTLRWL